jgi:hypothetical protein
MYTNLLAVDNSQLTIGRIPLGVAMDGIGPQ